MNLPSSSMAVHTSIDWKRIGLFWLLACLISWGGSRLAGVLMPAGSWAGRNLDTSIPVALGPLLAGLMVLGRIKPLSWTSDQPARAWFMMALLPLGWVVGAVIGQSLTANELTHQLLFTVSILVYCAGEEWGWRGFLYQALLPLPAVQRVFIGGLLWFGWHFVFYKDLLNPGFALTFLVMILAGTAGLNAAIARTKSIAVVTCLHALTKVNLPAPYSWGVMAAIVVLIITWPVEKTQPAQSTASIEPKAS